MAAPYTRYFTVAPVAGDNGGAGTDPTASAALFGDYLFVASAGQVTGLADYTISGLGSVPYVNIYFYFGANGNFVVAGSSPTPFVGGGFEGDGQPGEGVEQTVLRDGASQFTDVSPQLADD